ncbi:hypothetical protein CAUPRSCDRAFT_10471 [Caulochytrium protostelioides]|nr:hypothetical protein CAUPRSCDRAFT_10471 [Caulochytrium protostelioides]
MAPFSYFNVVCHRPPVVMISINVPPAGPKDTLANIKASGEFTVNIMSEWYVNSANYTCINAPAGYDEMAAGGVAKQPSTVVKPPLAADAAISFECTVLDPARTGTPMVPLRDDDGNVNTTVVFGLIEQVHVREDVLDERGNVDLAKLKPLGRAGGNDYVRVLEGFTLRRPAYSEGKQS